MILPSPSCWAGMARSSITSCMVPLPSWIAFGQDTIITARRPSSATLPKWPVSLWNPAAALQLPCVGRSLNWHGQA